MKRKENLKNKLKSIDFKINVICTIICLLTSNCFSASHRYPKVYDFREKPKISILKNTCPSKGYGETCPNHRVYYVQQVCTMNLTTTPSCKLPLNGEYPWLMYNMPGNYIYSNLLSTKSAEETLYIENSYRTFLKSENVYTLTKIFTDLYQKSQSETDFNTQKEDILKVIMSIKNEQIDSNRNKFYQDFYNTVNNLKYSDYTVQTLNNYKPDMIKVEFDKGGYFIKPSSVYTLSNFISIVTLTVWPYHDVSTKSLGSMRFYSGEQAQDYLGAVDVYRKKTDIGSILIFPAFLSKLLHDGNKEITLRETVHANDF